MRIGVVGLSHETNTFAAEQNDSVDCASIQVGEGVLANAHPRGFVGGFIEGTQGSGVELVPTVSIGFAHGGLVSAPLFEHCRDLIVEKLREVPIWVTTWAADQSTITPAARGWSTTGITPTSTRRWTSARPPTWSAATGPSPG